MTLQTQLRLIAVVTLLSLGAVIIFAIAQLSLLRSEFGNYRTQQSFSDNLNAIKSEALAISRADPILPETETRLNEADARVHALQKNFEAIALDEEGRNKLGHINALWDEYIKGFQLAFKIAATSPADALTAPDMLYRTKAEPMINDIEALIATNKDDALQAEQAIQTAVNRIIWIIVIPLLFAGGIIIAFQAVFNRRLKERVDEVVTAMNQLLDGNLTHRLPASYADEIGVMAHTVNNFVARFEAILREVNASAGQTILAADKVHRLTQSASAHAQEQSQKVFNASAAIEEMHRTVMDIADIAEQTAQIAQLTREQAQQSTAVGRDTIAGLMRLDSSIQHSAHDIAGLEQALEKIDAISNIIRDIAEKTNLLALNAAIEAARAGEYGRGFAVVADEVRMLSERTNNSARSISELLSEVHASANQATAAMSQARIEASAGVAQGHKISAVLASIENSMQQVADSMQHIAQSTQSQSQASAQLSSHIEAVSHISASTSENIETTRDEMSGLARTSEVLHKTISQFRFAHA